MAKAVITIEDVFGTQQVDFKVLMEGGFQLESVAHQTANLLLKHMDELGERKGEGDPVRLVVREPSEPTLPAAPGEPD